MSQAKPWGQAYLTTTIRSAKLPTLPHRYAPATQITFSITARTPMVTHRQKMSLNDEILTGVKRNYLHSQAYKRTQANKKIGVENDRLYKRINSQKSLYSQQSLNKSSVSIKSVSRCSSRQSTRQMQAPRQNKTADKKKQKKQAQMKLAQQNVEKMEKDDVKQFKNMFIGSQIPQKQSKTRKQNSTSYSFYSRPQSKQSKTKPVQMGNLLHRIAEQICQIPQIPISQQRRRSKRSYNN